jgi:1-acyl-sn-glycerol-3-phosphate acyltransferase
MSAELKVLGEENIPRRGGCILTINHYHRPGFGAQWIALAVTAVVPLKMRWAVTGELMCEGKWYRAIGSRASIIFLKRLAYIYGLITMPPMPPRPRDVEARAASVRAILEYVKHTNDAVLGISPEGYNPPNGVLTRPSAGFGRFALLLSKAGMRFIPVGGYEADGIFHIHFGKEYELRVTNDTCTPWHRTPGHTCPGGQCQGVCVRCQCLSADQKDEQAMQIIMRNIACQLPTHLRGEFA